MHKAKGGSLSLNTKKGKVREALRNPIDVLNSLKSKAGNESYCYERLYRNLYNKEFYLFAYQNLYMESWNLTKGAGGKAIADIGMVRLQKIIGNMKNHSYQPNPVRHGDNMKRNGDSSRIPFDEDVLVQEIVRLILNSIYEPVFSDSSHGFRTNRSCHTALKQVCNTFTGVNWFIQGNLCSAFRSMDYTVLIHILRRRIHDEYFIALVWKFLKAGYLEEWKFGNTYSGAPQGTLLGAVLSNVYLNELDQYMESRGCIFFALHDCRDRRLRYVRYVDSWLCGVTGSKQDAEAIRADVGQFLSETLKLELPEEKTFIVNAHDAVRFLSYDIFAPVHVCRQEHSNYHIRRAGSGKPKLYVPREKWQKKLMDYKVLQIEYHNGTEIFNPVHRTGLINYADVEIVKQYNTEIMGLYNYYIIADNVSVLGHFYDVMKFSMFKTFGAKYRLPVSNVRKKYEYKHFGVKYPGKHGEKTLYLYEGGFKKAKAGVVKPEVDTVQRWEPENERVLCEESCD